ncbi:MAG: PIN domain-containing protein [Chloroflexi bacterium]|nr:PIN domain-containing protein [Chloroflexota bacterium]
MLIDANLLIYAIVDNSPHHVAAEAWLAATLNGERRAAICWQTIGAFLRIVTHPRIVQPPLSSADATQYIEDWLATDTVWIPAEGWHTATLLSELIVRHHLTGDLIPDAQLAAVAMEHGLTVMSADSDFARFPEITWRNPLVN